MGAQDRSRANLARGPQVRSRRAELKRAIRDGDVDGLDVVAGHSVDLEDVATGMKMLDLLMAVPGVGTTTAVAALQSRGLPLDVRVYGLTIERRCEIAGALRKENHA